jgi:hypothetical protein
MLRPIIAFAASLALLSATGVAVAKEYNKRPHMPPHVAAKLNRALAGARNTESKLGSQVIQGDVVNTDCGALTVGNVGQVRPGSRVENNVIIKGDIINAPGGCNGRR